MARIAATTAPALMPKYMSKRERSRRQAVVEALERPHLEVDPGGAAPRRAERDLARIPLEGGPEDLVEDELPEGRRVGELRAGRVVGAVPGVAQDAAHAPASEGPDQVVDVRRVGPRDQDEDPVESVAHLDVGLRVDPVENAKRPLHLAPDARARGVRRAQVEDDDVEVLVVQGLLGVAGVVAGDEPEADVPVGEAGPAALPGSGAAGDLRERGEEGRGPVPVEPAVEDVLPARAGRSADDRGG